jgi:hypothetical protein
MRGVPSLIFVAEPWPARFHPRRPRPPTNGLQMNLAFQRRYATGLLLRKGTADRWTQIWVAVRAHRSGRGFHPWPRTARRCGLS